MMWFELLGEFGTLLLGLTAVCSLSTDILKKPSFILYNHNNLLCRTPKSKNNSLFKVEDGK